MSRATHVPLRTCVGCGKRAPQADLMRLTSTPVSALQVTNRPPVGGRCGYLHRGRECWERFAARKGLVRSLGCSVDKAQRQAFVQQLKAIEQLAMVRN